MDFFSGNIGVKPQVELGRRYFSVEQANRALVLVERIIADVLKAYQHVMDQQEILEVQQRRSNALQARRTQERIIELVETLQSFSDELIEIGAEMKDWSTGLVDFPALLNGREVQLCWRYGEKQVAFWHEIDDGCGGRRGLDTFQ